jgi:hypothetical protein
MTTPASIGNVLRVAQAATATQAQLRAATMAAAAATIPAGAPGAPAPDDGALADEQ